MFILASMARAKEHIHGDELTTYPCRIQSKAEHARHGVDPRLQDMAGWPEQLYSTGSRPWAWMASYACDEVATVSARASSLATRKKQNGNTMDQRICERTGLREWDALLTFTGGSLNHWLQRSGRSHCSSGEVPSDGAPSHEGTGTDVWVTRSYIGVPTRPRRWRRSYGAKQEVIGGGVDWWTLAAALWQELGQGCGSKRWGGHNQRRQHSMTTGELRSKLQVVWRRSSGPQAS
jgi:hypothetical protein